MVVLLVLFSYDALAAYIIEPVNIKFVLTQYYSLLYFFQREEVTKTRTHTRTI